MKIQASSAAVIAVAAAAVVVAAGGTTVAVAAASQVTVVDPTTAKAARVDGVGRLQVLDPAAAVNALTFVSYGTSAITSPTTATLAVSRVETFNTGRNTAYANTDFNVALVKINPGSSGTCYDSDASITVLYSRDRVPVGSNVADTYPAALVVKPTGSTPYCLGTSVVNDDSSSVPTSYYNPLVQLTAYVANGSYKGYGSLATPASTASASTTPPLTTPQNPHPDGVGAR